MHKVVEHISAIVPPGELRPPTLRVYYMWVAGLILDKIKWHASLDDLASAIGASHSQVRMALTAINGCQDRHGLQLIRIHGPKVRTAGRGRPKAKYSLVEHPSLTRGEDQKYYAQWALRVLGQNIPPNGHGQRQFVPMRLVLLVLALEAAKGGQMGVVRGLGYSDLRKATGVSLANMPAIIEKLQREGGLRRCFPGFRKNAFLGSVKTIFFINWPEFLKLVGQRENAEKYHLVGYLGCHSDRRTEAHQIFRLYQNVSTKRILRPRHSVGFTLDHVYLYEVFIGLRKKVAKPIVSYISGSGHPPWAVCDYIQTYFEIQASKILSSYWGDVAELARKNLRMDPEKPDVPLLPNWLKLHKGFKNVYKEAAFLQIFGEDQTPLDSLIESIVYDLKVGGGCTVGDAKDSLYELALIVLAEAFWIAERVEAFEKAALPEQDLSIYTHQIVPMPYYPSKIPYHMTRTDFAVELLLKEGAESFEMPGSKRMTHGVYLVDNRDEISSSISDRVFCLNSYSETGDEDLELLGVLCNGKSCPVKS